MNAHRTKLRKRLLAHAWALTERHFNRGANYGYAKLARETQRALRRCGWDPLGSVDSRAFLASRGFPVVIEYLPISRTLDHFVGKKV